MLGSWRVIQRGTHRPVLRFVKYARRYLAEAQYRFNRRFDLRSILRRLLRAAAVTSPCPATDIRAAEASQ